MIVGRFLMLSSDLRSKWSVLLSDHAKSGSSIASWCRSQGIPVSQFQYWRKRLSSPTAVSSQEWVSVAMSVSSGGCAPLTLRVGRVSIDVVPGFDSVLLSSVLTVLEERC
jgi:hypothetical protein